MERANLIDENRLATNTALETYQPHHAQGYASPLPIPQHGAVGVMSVISRGPLGVGAHYSMTEPLDDGYHTVRGAMPLVSRAVGA